MGGAAPGEPGGGHPRSSALDRHLSSEEASARGVKRPAADVVLSSWLQAQQAGSLQPVPSFPGTAAPDEPLRIGMRPVAATRRPRVAETVGNRSRIARLAQVSAGWEEAMRAMAHEHGIDRALEGPKGCGIPDAQGSVALGLPLVEQRAVAKGERGARSAVDARRLAGCAQPPLLVASPCAPGLAVPAPFAWDVADAPVGIAAAGREARSASVESLWLAHQLRLASHLHMGWIPDTPDVSPPAAAGDLGTASGNEWALQAGASVTVPLAEGAPSTEAVLGVEGGQLLAGSPGRCPIRARLQELERRERMLMEQLAQQQGAMPCAPPLPSVPGRASAEPLQRPLQGPHPTLQPGASSTRQQVARRMQLREDGTRNAALPGVAIAVGVPGSDAVHGAIAARRQRAGPASTRGAPGSRASSAMAKRRKLTQHVAEALAERRALQERGGLQGPAGPRKEGQGLVLGSREALTPPPGSSRVWQPGPRVSSNASALQEATGQNAPSSRQQQRSPESGEPSPRATESTSFEGPRRVGLPRVCLPEARLEGSRDLACWRRKNETGSSLPVPACGSARGKEGETGGKGAQAWALPIVLDAKAASPEEARHVPSLEDGGLVGTPVCSPTALVPCSGPAPVGPVLTSQVHEEALKPLVTKFSRKSARPVQDLDLELRL